MFFRKARTKVVEYKNERSMERGVKSEERDGYLVTAITSRNGSFKPMKAFLTGGIGYFTPGGLRRGEKYTVVFALADRV